MRIEAGFTAIHPVTDSPRASGGGFAGAIQEAMERVDEAQGSAQSAAAELLVNGRGDVHTVALAAQSAELSFELFQQVRNKFVSAYQEIMKMPM
ncbi:MAG TPA: flagellar hook-basal body complex protein FliE [Bryobacteraceae bacterium]|nr:flagellar hook-basal body complex protein FliE [Bryobacteraceae bacterium]